MRWLGRKKFTEIFRSLGEVWMSSKTQKQLNSFSTYNFSYLDRGLPQMFTKGRRTRRRNNNNRNRRKCTTPVQNICADKHRQRTKNEWTKERSETSPRWTSIDKSNIQIDVDTSSFHTWMNPSILQFALRSSHSVSNVVMASPTSFRGLCYSVQRIQTNHTNDEDTTLCRFHSHQMAIAMPIFIEHTVCLRRS